MIAGGTDTCPVRQGRFSRRRWRVLIVAAVGAVLLEGGARIQQYFDVGLFGGYEPRHLVDFYRFYRVNPAYRSKNIRINGAGFRRDEEVTRVKPANTIRVVLMGGSTVWGEDGPGPQGLIDNRDTIAAHLETALNERASAKGSPLRIEVINAGVVGYMLFQEETYFSTYIADFQPDLVIGMDGHNDLDALQLGLPLYRHRNDVIFDRELNRPLAFDVYRQLLRYGESKSLFIRRASDLVGGWLNRRALEAWRDRFAEPPSEERIRAWLDAYAATVRRFDASVRLAGAAMMFTVQLEVAGETRKPLTAIEVAMRDTDYAYYRWLHTTMRDRLIARMHTLRADHGVWFEDVSDAFQDFRERAYLDYTHLTSPGARAMAGRLAALVEPQVFCEAAARPTTSCRAAATR